VREAGGYRDGDFPEDYDLWLRLHARGHQLGKVVTAAPLLLWRDGPRRLSRTDPRYGRTAFLRLRQEHLERLEGPAFRGGGLVLWGATRQSRPWRRWLRQLGARPEFVVEINPKRIGRHILEAPVVDLEQVTRRPWRSMLVTVSGRGSRAAIRSQLAEWGLANGAACRHVRYV
jgi:hypothetical protein